VFERFVIHRAVLAIDRGSGEAIPENAATSGQAETRRRLLRATATIAFGEKSPEFEPGAAKRFGTPV
jgi:hypothetical protein